MCLIWLVLIVFLGLVSGVDHAVYDQHRVRGIPPPPSRTADN